MKARVLGRPTVEFSLTARQLEILATCSRMHYDSRCREASSKASGLVPNGFITIWQFHQQFNDDACDADRVEFPLTAEIRELDTACKILEMPTMDTAMDTERRVLAAELFALLREAHTIAKDWGREITV